MISHYIITEKHCSTLQDHPKYGTPRAEPVHIDSSMDHSDPTDRGDPVEIISKDVVGRQLIVTIKFSILFSYCCSEVWFRYWRQLIN